MDLPKARNENIIVNELENETLVYDLQIDKAYCLNQTSKIIYQACASGLTFEELKRKHKFTDDLIFLALDDLNKENLLADKSYKKTFDNMSRREVIKKVGLSSLVALPVITSLVIPTAAQAASCLAQFQTDCRVKPCCPGLTCFAGLANGTCF